MKKIFFCLLAVLGVAAACTQSKLDNPQEEQPVSNGKTITVVAGNAGTKTAISESSGGNFHLNWTEGDKIAVWEAVPAIELLMENPEYNGYVSQRYESAPLKADADMAVFELNLESREDAEHNGEIQYVAVYPASRAVDNFDCWNGDRNHMEVPVDMPDTQYPTADSFDPDADILVSKAVVCNDLRPDELSFHFARVGTIVKMTVGNLTPGARIVDGSILMGFDAAYYFAYDPEKERISISDGVEGINFYYNGNGIPVDSEGKAVIWLRTMSGVSKKIDLNLSLRDDTEEFISRSRRVSLRARGRTLEFKEGGLTEFTVGLPLPDIANPRDDEIQIHHRIADGLEGITAYWPLSTDEDFSLYDCFLMDEADTRYEFTSRKILDDTYYATYDGVLTPGTYTVYVRAVADDGKISEPDYAECTFEINM